MPTVSELLQDIDERMPNTFSTETKLRWMNNFQAQIFRKLNIPGIYSFETVADKALYLLPESCGIDLIEEVVYDGTHLEFKSLQQEAIGTFYYTVAGQIGIFPKPTEDGKLVTVFYNKRPEKLVIEKVEEQVPEIMEDYHELLILHVLITIAKAREDAELANAYTYDLNELMLNLQMDLIEREPEYTHTQDVFSRRGSAVDEEEW